MNTHNVPFSMKEKENHTKLSQTCSQGIFSLGLKNELEAAVVAEPSVFEPMKFYCILNFTAEFWHIWSGYNPVKIKFKICMCYFVVNLHYKLCQVLI